MPSSLIYATRMNHFLIGLLYTMTSDVRPVMTSSVVELRKSSKVLCKAKLAPKERSWSLFGDLLPIWSTIAFWIPVKPMHLRSMLSKSMRCSENCNTWSQHWSTERAQFFSTTKPNWTLYNQHFVSWTNWATKFCLILHIHLISHQLTTTSSSISTTLGRENASTTSRRQKMLSKSSWGMDFYTTRMSKLVSCWQKCVDCNGPYFD